MCDGKNPNPCKYYKNCGACSYQNMSYQKSLEAKQKTVNELLKSYGKVLPIIGMNNPYNYRNKVHAAFALTKDKNLICGTYEEGSHKIVNIDGCYIENKTAVTIIQTIKELAISFKTPIYNEHTHTGLLRHVLIRTGHVTGEVLVTLVLGSTFFPSKNNFLKELRKRHPEITSIVININNRHTSMILGDKSYVEYGKGYIKDILCNNTYNISPHSFYQVNHEQTEILYNTAIEFANLSKNDTIIDAYSGIGTIGMTAALRVKRVISVESNKSAVKDAKLNKKINQLNNVDIYEDDAGSFMQKMALNNQSADVVFMDPPRTGSDQNFMNSIIKLSCSKIIYISCNPVTLARDLQYLTKNNYSVKKIQPVDMFPWTQGIESVVLLSRTERTKREG